MNIAIIGAGNVGQVLGRRWAAGGHRIVFGSRKPESDKMQTLVRETGAQATTSPEAAQQADIVVIATPWSATEAVVKSLGDLSGKIVIDCTNPLGPGFEPALGSDTSAAEQIAGWAAGARVVKAFSTTGAANMADPDFDGQPLAMFICGDDAAAKEVVAELATGLGFDSVDTGPLRMARHLEPMAIVWIKLAYAQGWGPHFGFAVLKR